jgi:WD40 repeat protein
VYPADLPTVRNLAQTSASRSSAEDTDCIHLSQTPAPVPEFPRVRGYLIQSFIGSGGMGVVYKARHIDLQRTVALKLLHESAAGDREAHERFQAEAEAVARVQHPNIIQVFEIGSIQSQAGEQKPRPFLALEFLDGGNLSRYTEWPQAPTFAARMLEKLARAAHAAHMLGVVHRDLKPANVLLGKDGEPKIADFGVAKLSGEGERLLTQAGMTVGTPEYMAPEQAAGEDSGPAADIYSLGVILYQLLTARLPFHGANPMDTMYLVRNEEPVSPRSFQPNLPRDLETICLKCLNKKPGRRYETAEALANDLTRWAEGRTILARPVGRIERTYLWVKRNPTVAMLSAAIVIVTILGIAGVVMKWKDAEVQASVANVEKLRAQSETDRALMELYRADILAASSAIQLENALTARRLLDSVRPDSNKRNWEWRYLHTQLDTSQKTLQTDDKLYLVVSTPDAARIITTADGNLGGLWDPFNGKRLETFRDMPNLGRASAHPLGESIAYFPHTPGQTRVAIRHLRSDKPDIAIDSPDKPFRSLSYSRNGLLLAIGTNHGVVHVHDTATGRSRISIPAHDTAAGNSGFNRDNTRIATSGSSDRSAKVWDLRTGELVRAFPNQPSEIEGALLNDAGDRLITVASSPASIFWLWDVGTGEKKRELSGHANQVRWYGFNPDTTLFATCCLDQKARLWDVESGKLVHELRGHTGWVEYAAFHPSRNRIVTASHDCTLRLWDTETGHTVAVLRGHVSPVLNVAFSKDGRTIVSTSKDGAIKQWDVETAERGNAIRGHEKYVYGVACHKDNERIASASWDGTVRIWNARTGKQLHCMHHGHGKPEIVSSVAFQPNGDLLASVSRDNTVRLWDVNTGREVHRFDAPVGHWVDTRVAFSPDGSLLATGDNANRVRIWDVNTRTEYAVLEHHQHIIRDLAFSPDGRFLATGGADIDCAIRIWDVKNKRLAHHLKPTKKGEDGHSDVIYALAYSPDGKTLASGSVDGSVRLWDTTNWGESVSLKHAANVYGLAFTPDGTRLAAGCSDKSIRLWHVETRHELAELHGHDDYVHSVAFTPDGRRLVSGSGDNTIRIWDSGSPDVARP